MDAIPWGVEVPVRWYKNVMPVRTNMKNMSSF